MCDPSNGRRKAPRAPDPDSVIAALAAGHHGLVTRAQLLEAGVPVHVIEYRAKKGRLHRLHRGVYRVGPLPAPYERQAAAVLACGGTAVLSHRSAAAVWKLLPRQPAGDAVEVSVPSGSRAPGPSVRVHRVTRMERDEKACFEGIAVTAPARTVLDLAGSAGARALEQALARASRLHGVDHESVAKLLIRHPRRAGARALRALLAARAAPAMTRSEAESRFLALVRRSRLPAPHVNVPVQGFEVDFLWRAERLVVEIDGFAFHSSPSAFENDRRRDAVLAAAGFRVVRATWLQLTREPEVLLVRLAQALARSEGIGRPGGRREEPASGGHGEREG